MSGILANSASQSMLSGDTSPDNTVSDYVRAERITLATYPTGTSYAWTLTAPSGSGGVTLTDANDDAPSFVPDIQGTYVVGVTVDGTTYALRIGVLDTAQSENVECMRVIPRADAQVAAPALGGAVYYSDDIDALAMKVPAGTVLQISAAAGGTYQTMVPVDPDNVPYTEGRFYYDQDEKTFALMNDKVDVRLQIGQEVTLRAVNTTASTIADGSVVHISGAQGNRPTIALATGAVPAGAVLGVATHEVAVSEEGIVTVFGLVNGVDTSSFAAGYTLYLDPSTPGGLTDTEPTGTNVVRRIGVSLNSTVNGRILVDIRSPATIADQEDVNSGVPTDGNVLYGNGTHWTSTPLETLLTSGAEYGELYMTSSSATDCTEDVWSKASGTTSIGLSNDFDDGSASNRLRHTDVDTEIYDVNVEFTVTCAGTNQICRFGISKNGADPEAKTVQERTIGVGADYGIGVCGGFVSLAENDYVEFWVMNTSSDNDITINRMNMRARKVI